MSVVIDGTLGITSPAETVQGALTTTGNTILGDSSADTLNVGNGGLVKDASSNVGIGTSSPYGKFQVINPDASWSISGNMTSGSSFGYSIGGTALNIGGSTGITWIQSAYANNAGVAVPLAFVTGGTESMRITAAGLLQFNSGYGSVATAYGCRAWVNFNGTGTPAIRASGNVSSITDNGVGDYTVNLTTAMADTNGTVVGASVETIGAFTGGLRAVMPSFASTSTIRVGVCYTNGGAVDMPYVGISVFR